MNYSNSQRAGVILYLAASLFGGYIENSYSGKILEKKNGLQTTQTELAIHGIGLENVKKVVLANGGEIKTDYTSDRFCVQVLLYMSQIKN